MRIALTGNPNSGKTTMYNALTGRNEKVGNWAGVTVDKEGTSHQESVFQRYRRTDSGGSARRLLHVALYF